MGIAKFWEIVWDNTLFHWATAIVFLGAVIFESYAVWQYFSESRQTERAIAFLSQLRKGKSPQPSPEILTWLAEHVKINSAGNPEWQRDKFILLNYPSFLERSPRSSLRFVTALCTAIGVLGTFYGIQEGLQGVNLGFADSKELLEAIKNLLLGMRTAFSSSLMGLGAGSWFTLVLFGCDSLRVRQRDRLTAKLSRIFTAETPDFYFNSDAEFGVSARAIGEGAGERAIATQLLPLIEKIIQLQEKSQEFDTARREDLQTLILTIRGELIEPVVQQLNQSAQLARETSLAVRELNQELGGISQNLASSILTIQNFQQQTLVKLEEFAGNLKQTLLQFQTDTKGVLEQTAGDIHRAVSESIRGMEAQRAAFEASAETAAATFRNIREDLQAALHTQAEVEQQMLQGVQARTAEILDEANAAFQQQSATLQAVGDEASNLMRSAKIELLGGLQEIGGVLLNANQTVQSELEEFQENYQTRLQDFFSQSINGMQAQRRAFKESIADVAATFQEIREDWRQVFQGCQTQIEQVIAATGENGSRRRD